MHHGFITDPSFAFLFFQGAKAESGILKVDTKKDLEGRFLSPVLPIKASASKHNGGKEIVRFFFQNPPAKPKTRRIFCNDLWHPWNLCFFMF